MRALRPIHKHAQTSQVSTVTKWEIAGYAGMLEGNAAQADDRQRFADPTSTYAPDPAPAPAVPLVGDRSTR